MFCLFSRQNEWPWIYVSHKYKLLYCEIPKAGSSNWLKLFSVLNGIYNGTRSLSNNAVHYLPQVLLSHLTKSERVHALRTYTKFLVVREPMERALSAFRDKLERKPEFGGPMFRYLASKIVEKYRSPDSSFSISRTLSKVPRFDEFVEFVTDPNNTQLMLHYSEPRHWQPQSDLCYPCNIDYDYVLHMENIKYEADFMFRAEGLPSNVKYPPQTENEAILGLRKYDILMSRYYSSVRRQHIDALIRYYEKDYSLFGYTVPSIFYSWFPSFCTSAHWRLIVLQIAKELVTTFNIALFLKILTAQLEISNEPLITKNFYQLHAQTNLHATVHQQTANYCKANYQAWFIFTVLLTEYIVVNYKFSEVSIVKPENKSCWLKNSPCRTTIVMNVQKMMWCKHLDHTHLLFTLFTV